MKNGCICLIAHNANLIFPNMVRPDVALGVCLVQWS